ncbi:MAG: hypothetical protein GXN94_01330 [Aquificae bacterium]|nr:hypothetical protein [Aquificota bacterium]
MGRYLISLLLITFQFSQGGVCEKAMKVVIECFEDREKGGNMCKKPPFKEKLLIKACLTGCMSESLYEANVSAEMVKKECR